MVYAYDLQESTYLLFTLKEKSKIVLVDKIELIDDELKSLVYSDAIVQEKKED